MFSPGSCGREEKIGIVLYRHGRAHSSYSMEVFGAMKNAAFGSFCMLWALFGVFIGSNADWLFLLGMMDRKKSLAAKRHPFVPQIIFFVRNLHKNLSKCYQKTRETKNETLLLQITKNFKKLA